MKTVEVLIAALNWYSANWGTNSQEIKTRGYLVADEAIRDFRQKEAERLEDEIFEPEDGSY